MKGRLSSSNNLVLGDSSLEKWRELDEKVNEYPTPRSFKAIGEANDAFCEAMVVAVTDVVGPIHPEFVSKRSSKNGKYITVTVGPVWVQDADQVVQVYQNMRQSPSLKYML